MPATLSGMDEREIMERANEFRVFFIDMGKQLDQIIDQGSDQRSADTIARAHRDGYQQISRAIREGFELIAAAIRSR